MSAWQELKAWSRHDPLAWSIGALGLGLAVAWPLAGPDLLGRLTTALDLLPALYGLHLLAVQTRQPSLGQAAFLAAGAYTTAALRLRWGLDPLLATAVGGTAAAALGYLLGRRVAGLHPAALALGTWALGWLAYLLLLANPDLTGGGSGLPLGPLREYVPALGIDVTFDGRGHLALGAAVLVLALLLLRSAQRSAIGRGWAAVRDSPAVAVALGLDAGAVRAWAYVVAAGLAGLSGSLLAQQNGIVDPRSFDPATSLNLLIAVLVGGFAGFAGPVAGLLIVFGIPALLGTGANFATSLIAITALLVLSGRGPRALFSPGTLPDHSVDPAGVGRSAEAAPALEVRGLAVRFGGVAALAGVDLTLPAGGIHGVIGPNGSGKTTLLRCIAGAVPPDAGLVSAFGMGLGGLSAHARVRAGVARTFQRTAVMEELTCLEHVMAAVSRAGPGWTARALFKTPRYRAAAVRDRERARWALEMTGLDGAAGLAAPRLSAGRQRLLQLASAAGTGARLLLLDEPSAGMRDDELRLLETALARLRENGRTVVVVEHNLGFLARVVDSLTVLDQGRVIAGGEPAAVLADPAVRRAYGILGAA